MLVSITWLRCSLSVYITCLWCSVSVAITWFRCSVSVYITWLRCLVSVYVTWLRCSVSVYITYLHFVRSQVELHESFVTVSHTVTSHSVLLSLAPLHNALSALRFKWKITAYKYRSEVVLCISLATTLCLWLDSLIQWLLFAAQSDNQWQFGSASSSAATDLFWIVCHFERLVVNRLHFPQICTESSSVATNVFGIVISFNHFVLIIHCRQSPIWPRCLCMNQAQRKRMKLKGWKIKVSGGGWTSAILPLCSKLCPYSFYQQVHICLLKK